MKYIHMKHILDETHSGRQPGEELAQGPNLGYLIVTNLNLGRAACRLTSNSKSVICFQFNRSTAENGYSSQ